MPQLNLTQAKPYLIKTALALMSFMAFYYIGVCSRNPSTYEQQVATWKAKADSALVQNALVNQHVLALQSQIDSTLAKGQAQTDEIERLKKQAAAAHVPKRVVDSVIAQAPDTCKAVAQVASQLQAENTVLAQTIADQDTRDSTRLVTITKLTLQTDTLKRQNTALNQQIANMVKTVPVYKEPKLLGFIPLPSRVASFVAGGIIGVGGTVAVIHAVK